MNSLSIVSVSNEMAYSALNNYFLPKILGLCAIVMVVGSPIGFPNEEEEGRTTANQLFHQLNDILKREINKDIKNDSIEVGDKIKGDDGKLHINVQHTSGFSGFPVSFRPKDEEILDDKKVITLVSNFKGESEYVIKKDHSDPPITTKAGKSFTEQALTTEAPKAASASTTASITIPTVTFETSTNKNHKLLTDIAEEPVILSHV